MRQASLAFAVALLSAAQAFAQVQVPPAADPGAVQQRQMDDLQRRQEQEREQRKSVVDPLRRDMPAPAVVQPGAEVVRFMVREIRFTKSEILSAEELDAVARDFRGRELSLADLQKIATRINEIYKRKGVVTAQALVPPQDVTTGVVTIRLVEGRLGKVRIKGNDSTDESYVVARLGLRPADLMDLALLEASLVRFNRTNDVQMRVELAPGERFATTDIGVVMTEPPRHDMRLTYDNMGFAATGRDRTGLSYLNRSVLGFRDDLGLSVTQATGQFSHSVSYGFPFNTWGGRVNLGYFNDKTAIKNGLLATLKITGESVARVVSVRQPTIVDKQMQIDIVAGGKTRRSYNWIDKVLLQRIDTEDRNFGIEAQLFDARSTWFASYIHSDGQAQITQREGFRIQRGAVRHNRSLIDGLSFRGNLTWQSTQQVLLPSSEQSFIGGEGSVRGYPVGVYSGDTGQTLNLELHHPLVAASPATGGFGATGFFFADYGRVKPYRAPNSSLPKHESLTGFGWGMHAAVDKRLHARLTIGYGATRVPQQPRNYEITLQLIGSVF